MEMSFKLHVIPPQVMWDGWWYVGNVSPLPELSDNSDTNTLGLGLPRQIFT